MKGATIIVNLAKDFGTNTEKEHMDSSSSNNGDSGADCIVYILIYFNNFSFSKLQKFDGLNFKDCYN